MLRGHKREMSVLVGLRREQGRQDGTGDEAALVLLVLVARGARVRLQLEVRRNSRRLARVHIHDTAARACDLLAASLSSTKQRMHLRVVLETGAASPLFWPGALALSKLGDGRRVR